MHIADDMMYPLLETELICTDYEVRSHHVKKVLYDMVYSKGNKEVKGPKENGI